MIESQLSEMIRRGMFIAVAKLLAAAPALCVDCARDVEPIFRAKCDGCHGNRQAMSGLRLDSREAALAGGYSGKVILPGKSGESKLIQLVSDVKPGVVMPPAGERLTSDEINTLRAWIDEGAKGSDRTFTQPEARTKSSHWA